MGHEKSLDVVNQLKGYLNKKFNGGCDVKDEHKVKDSDLLKQGFLNLRNMQAPTNKMIIEICTHLQVKWMRVTVGTDKPLALIICPPFKCG